MYTPKMFFYNLNLISLLHTEPLFERLNILDIREINLYGSKFILYIFFYKKYS